MQCIDGFSLLLQRYMLGKVMMQRIQQFSAFLCYQKNPVKCGGCVYIYVVARKIETMQLLLQNLADFSVMIQSIEFQFGKQIVQKPHVE